MGLCFLALQSMFMYVSVYICVIHISYIVIHGKAITSQLLK